ncbi:iron-containing alcohol dehydrogenase [Anaerovorax odorimutans]|uniref:Iron-containing alcohol dehydrogenase n=1 Tax=Anaerovorax odorimutans TaxID=109327 RepID=A0ABT1RM07_9FIRM|nr:iron-containing alcohol dehydrogenase [Anaerovorax odorimutans]MCQ4636207.1 iron-containing alcohol dehydrogenase [Anaerovorax odorimutans]
MEFIFNVPSKIMFGENYADSVGQFFKEAEIDKIMCIYDKGVKSTGIVERVLGNVSGEGISVVEFDEVVSDPPADLVDKAAGIARSAKVKGVLGIGGGSTMDTAKCVNALLGNEGNILDYSHDYDTMRYPGGYLILVPTTFGTSSEVTDGGVLSVPEENRKVSIWGKHLGADLAVIDPTLALGIPKGITAATGMDSLAHAVESYMSMIATPITEALSLQAIRTITEYLPKAVNDGHNLEYRTGMCLGCLTAGLAFNNAFQNQGHGIAHPMGAYWHIPHGVACAIALPFSIKDNVHAMPEKVKTIGEIMGLEIPDDMDIDDLGTLVAAAVEKLAEDVGIPNLKELGADPELIQTVAEAVKSEPDQYTYPHVPKTEDIVNFLRSNRAGSGQKHQNINTCKETI